MAQERCSSAPEHPRERPWWERERESRDTLGLPGPWPPKRLPKLQTMWVAVDAADPSRQGRTVDGHVYYWNRETNETTWTSPWGGRRSQLRSRMLQVPSPNGSLGARVTRNSGRIMFGRRSAGRQVRNAQASLVLEYMSRRPTRQAMAPELQELQEPSPPLRRRVA